MASESFYLLLKKQKLKNLSQRTSLECNYQPTLHSKFYVICTVEAIKCTLRFGSLKTGMEGNLIKKGNFHPWQ
jgi:hypothetical protein